MNFSVRDVAMFRLRANRDARGELTVIELAQTVPFPVVRMFYIRDVPATMARGGHAHRVCNQFLVCQTGQIRVVVFDGEQSAEFALHAGDAIWIPPTLYATETFEEAGSMLMVLCDRPYEALDYVNGLDLFKQFRASRR